MRAIHMTAAGGPEVLRAVEIPEPEITSPTQVKVRLHAAGVNPVDTKIRSRGLFLGDGPPAVLGCDGAGTVVETGAAVSGLGPGDEVWFCHGGLGGAPGNYAEYTVLEADQARRKPASIDFETAAAGPLVLITAWEALMDRARLQAGQTVLVHAGAGGVGHVAIQLARQAGARVLTTVSGDDKARLVQALGADHTIDYRAEDLREAVAALTDGRGADVVFDTVGPAVFRDSLPLVAHYGDLVTLLDPGADVSWGQARARNLRIGFVLMLTPMMEDLPDARRHQGGILDRCAAMIDQGRLRLEVSQVYPLEQAADAHRDIEQGHTVGKRVLRTL